MLKLFFHRDSLFVKLSFGLALASTALYFFTSNFFALTTLQKTGFLFFMFQVFFAKLIQLYPWYPKNAKGPGIRLQFDKAWVPVSCLWLFQISLLWMTTVTWVIWLLAILLVPITGTACILIFFHWRDPDPSDPNVLSGHG